MDPIDCVMWSFILPQYLYLDGMGFGDYIFKYEELDTCVNFIRNRLGYTIDISRRPRSFEYKLHNVDFRNSQIRRLIYEYYEEDYKQLNY